MAGLANMLGLGGGMPSAEQMAKLAQQMPGGLPGAIRRAAGRVPPAAAGLARPAAEIPGGPLLPGLGGKPPGLGGFPGLGKKK